MIRKLRREINRAYELGKNGSALLNALGIMDMPLGKPVVDAWVSSWGDHQSSKARLGIIGRIAYALGYIKQDKLMRNIPSGRMEVSYY